MMRKNIKKFFQISYSYNNVLKYQKRFLNQHNTSKHANKMMSLKDRFQNYDHWRNVEKKELSFSLYKEFFQYCIEGSKMNDNTYVDKAFSILEDLKEDGYYPDHSIYVSMIQTCARAGNLETAEKLFQTIKEEEFQLDQITYLAMVRACSLVDNKKKAKEYFDEMYKLELCPDFIVFEDLYTALKNL